LGQQLLQLKQEAAIQNTNNLKIMQYLCPPASSEGPQSFLDFKFDLSGLELEKIIASVKGMLKYDKRSVYFILIYLQISANRLQKGLTPILRIEEKIANCITLLSKSLLDIDPSPSFTLPSFPKQSYCKKTIDFTGIAKDSRVDFA
jgi:hypothetical protein